MSLNHGCAFAFQWSMASCWCSWSSGYHILAFHWTRPDLSSGCMRWRYYCWWQKFGDHQLRLVVFPILYRVSAPSFRCFFLPDFSHQQPFLEVANLFRIYPAEAANENAEFFGWKFGPQRFSWFDFVVFQPVFDKAMIWTPDGMTLCLEHNIPWQSVSHRRHIELFPLRLREKSSKYLR